MSKIINKRLVLSAFVSFFVGGLTQVMALDAPGTSKTFFSPRSTTADSTIELALSNYHLYHNNYDYKVYTMPQERALLNLQATYFSQYSTNDADLAAYFLPGGKTHANVKEDGTGDIGSVWLGLISSDKNFDSTFWLRPNRTVYGAAFNYHHDMSEVFEGLWLGLLLPVVHVEHDMQFGEVQHGSHGVAENMSGDQIVDIQDALNSSDFLYGKVSPTKLTKTGLDDMQIKLGYNIVRGEEFHVGVYADVLVPLGDRPTAEFLFEPVIGNGDHTGLGLGVNLDYRILEYDKDTLHFLVDLKYRHLFSSTQQRSFDLMNGDWSRYLLVAKKDDPTTPLPGINFFTRDFTVRPGGMVDLWTALHYQRSELHIELGYNMWWRNHEKVSLRYDWQADVENLGIFDIAGDQQGNPVTASKAKISNSDFGDFSAPSDIGGPFVKITAKDLNLNSAAHQSVLTHKFYGAASLNTTLWDNPCMIGGGASYEYADSNIFMDHQNTGLDQWAIWLKAALSF